MSDEIYQSSEAVKRVRRPVDDPSQADSERKTVSVEEAARILGISRGAAYAYANNGSIPTIRLGKRLLVLKAGLNKLLMTG
jgi:excisionase family DNA binding protein